MLDSLWRFHALYSIQYTKWFCCASTSHFDLLSKDITMEGSGLYNSTELGSDNITVLPIEEKIVRAIVLSMVLLVGMVLNAIVILYTICHPKSLKQSSIIFLLGSSLVNLTILLSYIPIQVVTTFTGFESAEKILCSINGFLTTTSGFATNYILAIISVDRFFFLVKPLFHRQYFKPKFSVSLLVAMFVALVLHQSTNIAYDRYIYIANVNFCISARYVGVGIVILSNIVTVIPVIIITVTTAWTFLSTCRFIKSNHRRRVDAIGSREEVAREMEDNLYTKQIKNLFGIFSMLLISQVVSQVPQVVVIILSTTLGPQNLPPRYSFASALFFYIGSITNPIIQSYFRKDLSDTFKAVLACIKDKNVHNSS